MSRGRRAVLITRPEPGLSATAARIAAMGLQPVLASMLAIEPIVAELPQPVGLGAILVTSGNAVEAIPPVWREVRLLTVGDATARRARAAGFARVCSANGDASALAETATRLLSPTAGALLLASGAGQGEELAKALRTRGFAVIRREVYAARPVDALPTSAREALDADTLRAALFFSAETARVFSHLASAAQCHPQVRAVDALAIGRAAAVALEALPWRSIRVAARPTQDEMLALLR